MSCTRSQSPLARVDGSALGGTAVCWKPGATYAPAELRSATDVTLLYFRMRLYSMNLPRAADAGRLAVINSRKKSLKRVVMSLCTSQLPHPVGLLQYGMHSVNRHVLDNPAMRATDGCAPEWPEGREQLCDAAAKSSRAVPPSALKAES